MVANFWGLVCLKCIQVIINVFVTIFNQLKESIETAQVCTVVCQKVLAISVLYDLGDLCGGGGVPKMIKAQKLLMPSNQL